jgi:hypothetical protein
MSKTIVSIQTPGQDGRYDKFFRIPVADSRADTIRKAITEWSRKPSDFLIGNKRPKDAWKSPPKTAPVIEHDDERVKEL